MQSPRSRGKGGRRVPWRDGGRAQRKAAAWRKQATHAVAEASLLSGDLVELRYACPSGRTAAEGIYLFDQEMARVGVRYHAELGGLRRFPVFALRVPVTSAETIRAIIARVEKR